MKFTGIIFVLLAVGCAPTYKAERPQNLEIVGSYQIKQDGSAAAKWAATGYSNGILRIERKGTYRICGPLMSDGVWSAKDGTVRLVPKTIFGRDLEAFTTQAQSSVGDNDTYRAFSEEFSKILSAPITLRVTSKGNLFQQTQKGIASGFEWEPMPKRSVEVRIASVAQKDDQNMPLSEADYYSLAETASEDTPALIDILENSEDENHQYWAAAFLTDSSKPEAMEALIRGLRSTNKFVRKSCARNLAKFQNPRVVSEVQKAWRSGALKSTDVAYVLKEQKSPEFKPLAITMLKEKSPASKQYALEYLASINAKDQIPLVEKLLHDADKQVRCFALITLCRLTKGTAKEDSYLGQVAKEVVHWDWLIQSDGIDVLADSGNQRFVPVLIALIDVPNQPTAQFIQASCAKALGKIRSKEALPRLRRLSVEGEGIASDAAFKAIREIEGKKE